MGFEPTLALADRFSRAAPSTTRTPLRARGYQKEPAGPARGLRSCPPHGTLRRSRGHVPVHRHRGVDAARASRRVAPPGRPSSPATTRCCAAAIEDAGGVVVKTEGDAFFAAFAGPLTLRSRGRRSQRAVAGEPWPDGGRAPGPDGPPPRRGTPPARAARRRAGGLRRHRRELRRADRGRRRTAARSSCRDALVEALSGQRRPRRPRRRRTRPTRACARSRTSRSRGRSTGSSSPAPPTTRAPFGPSTRRRTCRRRRPSFVGRDDEIERPARRAARRAGS